MTVVGELYPLPVPENPSPEYTDNLWFQLERHERAAEHIRRILKLLPPEKGLTEGVEHDKD